MTKTAPAVRLGALFGVVALYPAPVLAAEEIPSIIQAEFREDPVWVSAEAATTPAGEVNWDLLGPDAVGLRESVGLNVLERHEVTLSVSGITPDCIQYGAAYAHYVTTPSQASLDSYLRDVHEVVVGTVTATAVGFFEDSPATLLQVVPQSTFRHRETRAPQPAVVYVAHPYATFSIGTATFCRRTTDFLSVPRVGDGVAIFSHNQPLEGSAYTYDRLATQMLWLPGGGRGDPPAGELALLRLFDSHARSAPSAAYREELFASIERLRTEQKTSPTQ